MSNFTRFFVSGLLSLCASGVATSSTPIVEACGGVTGTLGNGIGTLGNVIGTLGNVIDISHGSFDAKDSTWDDEATGLGTGTQHFL